MSSVVDDQEQEQLAEGTLISHLIELRSRIMKSMLAVLVVFLCLVPFTQEIFTFVSEPLRDALPEGQTMIATRVASPFLTPFMTTLFVALFITMPVVLRSEEHTSELQSRENLVCRLLLEKKKLMH